MRNLLLPTLLLCLGLSACADHSSSGPSRDRLPSTPVNQPDPHVISPDPNAGSQPGSGGNTEPGGGQPGGGEPGGGQPGGGTPPGSGNGPGGGPEGGGGSPVPEPGTLLLVGSGLAGLAGAALRRRRKQAPTE